MPESTAKKAMEYVKNWFKKQGLDVVAPEKAEASRLIEESKGKG